MSTHTRRLGVAEAELLFVDGFAGPGRYVGGQLGSPILAVESVLRHSREFPIPITFLFIEQDNQRYCILRDVLEQYKEEIYNSPRIKCLQVKRGDCETVLTQFLHDFEKTNRKLGPAFFFLDQSGYSDVSIQLIRRIMAQPLCEIFSYLNWDHMNRFLVDQSKWPSINKTFGGDEWRKVHTLETNKKPSFMLTTYKTALKEKTGSKYVSHFSMCDKADKLLYWLFFCTNNLRGLEEMKKAMWKVDPQGGFRFSDKDDPCQLSLFQTYTDEILAHELNSILSGQTLTVSQVKEFVLTQTPACLYKTALKLLEEKGLLNFPSPPANRRRGTFPHDHMQIQFL